MDALPAIIDEFRSFADVELLKHRLRDPTDRVSKLLRPAPAYFFAFLYADAGDSSTTEHFLSEVDDEDADLKSWVRARVAARRR